MWPFKVIPGPGDKPMKVVNYKVEEKQFAAEEISSMILMKMREIAEAYLGSTVKNAVVTLLSLLTFLILSVRLPRMLVLLLVLM